MSPAQFLRLSLLKGTLERRRHRLAFSGKLPFPVLRCLRAGFPLYCPADSSSASNDGVLLENKYGSAHSFVTGEGLVDLRHSTYTVHLLIRHFHGY